MTPQPIEPDSELRKTLSSLTAQARPELYKETEALPVASNLSDLEMDNLVRFVKSFAATEVNQTLDRLKDNLPEEKQLTHVLNADENGDVYREKFYRYGGFDFAIRLVKEAIDKEKR